MQESDNTTHEPIFPSTITEKLYNERAILIATFIGGPLAGGFLLARNFNAMNEPSKGGKTWIAAIGILLVVIGTSFLPALDKVPAVVYSFVLCYAAHLSAKKFQGSRIAMHQANGGKLYSTWHAVLIGFGFTIVMIALFLGLFYLQSATITS